MPLGVSSAESAHMVRNALFGAALLGVVAMPAYGQFVNGGGGGTGGGGITGGVFAVGNTVNSSSGAPAGNSLTVSATGGISAGMSGSTLLLSGATGAASATNMSQGVVGNTTGATSSQTAPLTAQTLSGAGAVSLGYSLGTAVISAPVPVASATSAGVTALGNTTGLTSSQSQALTAQTISAAGGLSAGMSNGTLVLSGATGGAGGGVTMSMLDDRINITDGTTFVNHAVSSKFSLRPLYTPQAIAINQLRFLGNNIGLFFGSSTSAGTTSGSQADAETISAVIYSQSAPNEFSSLSVFSGLLSENVTVSHAASSWSITNVVTFPLGTGTSSLSSTNSSLQGGTGDHQFSGPLYPFFTSTREIDLVPAAPGVLPPGNYYVGLWQSSSATNFTNFDNSQFVVSFIMGFNFGEVSAMGVTGLTNSFFIGTISSSSSVGSFNISNISDTASVLVPYIMIGSFT